MYQLPLEIIFVLFSIYFDLYWMKQLSGRTRFNREVKLEDMIHNLTDKWYRKLQYHNLFSRLKIVKEICCYFPFIFSLVRCPVSYVWRYVKLFAFSHLVRPLFFLSTTLPRCKTRHNIRNVLDCLNGGNHDLIFSGHAVGLFLSCHALCQYFNYVSGFGEVWYVYGALISFLIVFMREHYTVDILVSFLVTALLVK